MRGTQHHTRRVACLECFLPARGAEAPTVTWVQSWKAERGNWCRKIVAARFGKFEKGRSHDGADRVTANVFSPGVAAAIPIKSCHGFDRADIKRLAEHVSGATPPIASVTPIVPQHSRLSPLQYPASSVGGAQLQRQALDNGIVLSPVAFGAVRKRPGLQEGPQRREK